MRKLTISKNFKAFMVSFLLCFVWTSVSAQFNNQNDIENQIEDWTDSAITILRLVAVLAFIVGGSGAAISMMVGSDRAPAWIGKAFMGLMIFALLPFIASFFIS